MLDDAKPPEAGEDGNTIYGDAVSTNNNLYYLKQQALELSDKEKEFLDNFIIGWLSSSVPDNVFQEAVKSGIKSIKERRDKMFSIQWYNVEQEAIGTPQGLFYTEQRAREVAEREELDRSFNEEAPRHFTVVRA
jgi:hypothetical protein